MKRRRLLQSLLAGLALQPFLAASANVRIRQARAWNSSESWRLVLELDGPPRYRTFSLQAPERLILDLPDAQLLATLSELPLDGPVRAIRSGQLGGGGTRIVLDLRQAVRPRSFALEPQAGKGHRLVLDLYPQALAAPPEPMLALARPLPSTGREILVVVDAGHGGKDPGAVGSKGEREKDVALAIARLLARRIDREKGFKARLVRNGDVFVPLRKRPEVARRYNADMFVSVHADAAPRLTASGASVYALSEHGASSTMARWMADRENGADLIGNSGNLPLQGRDKVLAGVILDMALSSTIASSLDLGHSVLGQLSDVTALHQKRVEQAGFAVLKSPDIPSILVETGFISNRGDCRRLMDERHRQRLAEAIFVGVQGYFRQRPPAGSYLAALSAQSPG
ncbi:TPA: N-acetylmuramoyl-L-alanine amidase [Pseudomonas aeruginosa]|uniref:N-acetylmuramoyl-L-alanine amidase n=1 Tax=Pseudomonas aeruginosa TaxID=287 RepID=UPI000FC43197|nr:N-acetylmuramoyl-L-alanine amidase [Pseudomonas aeruginosa]MEE3525737.1 N-acetylmuramoyl-L-alanine amidase [Pseudomonas aeruginosa]NBK31924.1 AMIN domain-containing protein [Pseudomonas aeruginosa]NBY87279.1 AMIN domain-containing protein [Pseudomonas aeruginosa]NPX04784.1 AMIN domain-containing protein [Pseudomonas aeruginosa]RUK22574.1 AMIN domain-containing protein [Pseudomonas aeruginosa]